MFGKAKSRALQSVNASMVLVTLSVLAASAMHVDAYSIIHTFRHEEGSSEAALTPDGLGNLYGTTMFGGSRGYGTVFRLKSDGTAIQILHSFTGNESDGKTPRASLILDASGILYGTTEYGGSSGAGTVFKMKTDGTGFQTLHSFNSNGQSDGYGPRASLLLDASGNLYGTAYRGGASGWGTVFRIKTDGSGFRLLRSFSKTAGDGYGPLGALILDGSGDLYGTTEEGGPSDEGTVFKMKTDGTEFQLLHSFTVTGGAGDGQRPRAAVLLDGSGILYGTTYEGGSSDKGTLFRVKTDGTGFQVLHSFTGGTSNGANPLASLILDGAGNLYGTTEMGGADSCTSSAHTCGTVFKVKTDGTGFQVLKGFQGSVGGARPGASLILDSTGDLLGTTPYGGSSDSGTVFKVKTDGTAFQLLHSFRGAADGLYPETSLVADGSGYLYGTTLYGGSSAHGTVFKMKPDGTAFQRLHSFEGGTKDGASPRTSLVIDGSGYLFGTTEYGGESDWQNQCGTYSWMGCGTVFKMKTDGTGFQILHSFKNREDGYAPYGALMLDGSGYLYGTTRSGGWPLEGLGQGTVFSVKTDGTAFTVVHSFKGGASDGASPCSPVLLDSSGYLYGTTERGGSSDWGTVYRMKTNGSMFQLLSSLRNGPHAALILDGAGNLYGTTPTSIFKMKPDGTGFQTLMETSGSDAALILDGAGNLYGTNGSRVFTMKTDGAGFRGLHTFLGYPSDGSNSKASLILDNSGNLYGTTRRGGVASDYGTVFTLPTVCVPPSAPAITMTSGTNPACTGASVTLDAGAGYESYSWSTGATTRTITLSPSTTTTYSVQVMASGCSDLSAAGSVTVTVIPIPGIPTATNDSPKCEGGTIQLSTGAVSGAAYRWTGPNGFTSLEMLPALANVTQAMAGDYFVRVTVGGCPSAAGKTTVAVHPRPAKPVISCPATAKMSQTFLASVPPFAGITYQWTVLGSGTLTSGQGTASITVTTGNEGTLTVKVTGTDTAGCASQESSVQVSVFDPAKFLVLHGGKVLVHVSWRNQYSGQTGGATAIPKADQYGYLFFSDANNPEVFVKVLDFGASSPFLLFWAGLTDFEYTVTFTNTTTGASASFNKPAGSTAGGANTTSLPHMRAVLWDANANTTSMLPQDRSISDAIFEGVQEEGRGEAVETATLHETIQGLPGPAAEGEILLANGQVAVSATWKSQYTGETGMAIALPQKDEFCFFHFGNAENPEVFVKVLDWGAPGPFKLFAAGLTDYEYSVTFRNVNTGTSVVFTKPAGTYSGYAANMER